MHKKSIFEAKDLKVYKALLRAMNQYCEEAPATSVDRLFDILVAQGKKILPSDKRALAIIEYILLKTSPESITNLLNLRFRDLPINLRPITKSGRRHEVAFWCVDKQMSDKIVDLINFRDLSGSGYWSDAKGEKVELIDTTDLDESKLKEEEEKTEVTKTFKITASSDMIMKRFENFLGFLHFNGGHSGLFAMSFDGDGSDRLTCDPEPQITIGEGKKEADSVAGSDVEIANEDGYQGMTVKDKAESYGSDTNESKLRI
jgi:hypothetical protein